MYFYIGFAVLTLGVVPVGFGESFQNRPTENDLEVLVVFGTQCALGVNERCQAAQVSSPFVKTNSAGWYLDQSTMGTMASKIKALVPCYADPDTIYNGTTNISMYMVAGLFTELNIGNHADKFTQTFASGTNAVVYGDSPWRICWDNLDERYDVLNALQKTIGTMAPSTNSNNRFGASGESYAYIAGIWETLSWQTDPFGLGIAAAWVDNFGSGPWTVLKVRNYAKFYAPAETNINYTVDLYGHVVQEGDGTPEFLTFEAPGNEYDLLLLDTFSSPLTPLAIYSSSAMYGNSSTIVPDPGALPSGTVKSWMLKGYPLVNWDFQYCP